MYQADGQGHDDPKSPGADRRQVLREKNIRKQDRSRGAQLDGRPVHGGYAGKALVGHHYGGVEDPCPEAQDHSPGADDLISAPKNARHQEHAEKGAGYADELSSGQLFTEDQRGRQNDEDRLHVIAEGRDAHRRITVRFEQEDPVDPHEDSADDHGDLRLPHGLEIQLFVPQLKIEQKHQRPGKPPGAGEDRGA